MHSFRIAWVETAFEMKKRNIVFFICCFRVLCIPAKFCVPHKWNGRACALTHTCVAFVNGAQCVLHKFIQYKSYLCRMQLSWINALIVSLRVSCNKHSSKWSQFSPGRCEGHFFFSYKKRKKKKSALCKKERKTQQQQRIINANYDWFPFFTRAHTHTQFGNVSTSKQNCEQNTTLRIHVWVCALFFFCSLLEHVMESVLTAIDYCKASIQCLRIERKFMRNPQWWLYLCVIYRYSN